MTEITLENMREKAVNIYEAVHVMAKRARQINEEQKRAMELEMENQGTYDMRDTDDFGDVEIDRDALKREFKVYPKPTRAAMQEMVDNEIEFTYKTAEDE